MDTSELAHEFYEANQNAPTEERDTDARIVSHTDSWTRRCDSAVHAKIKIGTEALILMLFTTIV